MQIKLGFKGIDELASIIDAIKVKAEDLTPQQEIRLQLIQNVLAGKDPELLAKLLGLVSEGWSPMGDQMESVCIIDLVEYLLYHFRLLTHNSLLILKISFWNHKKNNVEKLRSIFVHKLNDQKHFKKG